MPKLLTFPKDLQLYPEELARELYIYRIVGRGMPRVFYQEFEDRERAKEEVPEGEVAFRFHDLVMFFAAAAASGVIGNFTYAVIRKAVEKIRHPRLEIASKGISFDAVVSQRPTIESAVKKTLENVLVGHHHCIWRRNSKPSIG